MNTGVVVTILTALASIAAAFISWHQASRTAKVNAQANLDLERLRNENTRALEKEKAESEKRLKAYERACQEVMQAEAAINSSWQRMQRVKDLMRWYSTETPESESNPMLRELEDAIRDFDKGYSLIGVDLPREARGCVHHAKMPIMHFLTEIHRVKKKQQISDDDREQFKGKLDEARKELTDYQTQLVESKENLRRERMKEILASWSGEADANKGKSLPTPKA